MGFFPAAVRDGGRAQLHLSGAVIDPTDVEIIRASARRGLSPELRLRLTVLLHAFMELRRFPPASPDGAAVRAWFASDAEDWPYAVVPLCEALGVEPAAVRARARALEPAWSLDLMSLQTTAGGK